MWAAFPNLASFGILVYRDDEGRCYCDREEIRHELAKRGLWDRFHETLPTRKKNIWAGDAEKTLYGILQPPMGNP